MKAFCFDTVDSTNDAAKRLVAAGQLRGTGYVLAREQTAGRGTHGRTWCSPRDAGLYLSVVRTDAGPATADTRILTLAAGAACAEALKDATSVDVRLKPINDLIVGGRKLGGILTEASIESGHITSLIIGIGINLYRADRPLSPEAMASVCLEELLPIDSIPRPNSGALAEVIAARVDDFSVRVLTGEIDAIRRDWEGLLVP